MLDRFSIYLVTPNPPNKSKNYLKEREKEREKSIERMDKCPKEK
jgi:hypothetical protein